MGLYDTIYYKCPNCGKETSSQTKIGDCQMRTFELSDEFSLNGKILMKDPCEHCNKYNCMVVDKVIIGFENSENATLIEKQWGNVIKNE